MLHAQEKNFNKPRNPVFLMPIDIELHKASIDHFFLLTAMIISWFHGTVARTEVKHALFGPLELPSKTNLKHIFFLRVSTGFLRVRKPEFFFFKPGIMTGFLRFTSAFLRVLKSTIKKKHNFPSWKTNLSLGPLNPENNVELEFLCKFTFKVEIRGRVNNLPLTDLKDVLPNGLWVRRIWRQTMELQQPTQLVSHA